MSGVGHWRYELARETLTWSDEVYRIHGVDRATFDPNYGEAVGFYHPDDQITVKSLIARAIERQKGFSFQLRLVTDAGDLRNVLCKAECELTALGATKAVYGVFQDITSSVASHDAIARSEARYRHFAENATDIFVEKSVGGILQYVSPAIVALTGYRPEDVVGRVLADFVHRRDKLKVEEAFRRAIEGGPPARIDYKLVCKDGKIIWVEARPSTVRNPTTGEIICITDVLRDVTAWKRAKEALASSEARYRLIADNASDVIATFTPMGEISFVSPACRKTLGFDPNELIGRRAVDMAHPDDQSAFRAYFVDLLTRRVDVAGEPLQFRCQQKDGAWVWLEGRPKLYFDDISGELIEVQDVLRDISARKVLEAQLISARAEAEAAAAAKADFLANMSHELRTPLTSIIGFTNLAAEQAELSDLTRDYVDRVGNASRALLCAVNDILDFSKLEAGQVSFHPEPVAIAKLCRATIDLFAPQAGAKDLSLILDGDDAGDGLVIAIDPDRIRQILLNLVGNAVKFTASGGVTLRTRYNNLAQRLCIEVIDTGAGLSDTDQDRLFRRFSQIDGSLTRAQSGTGLGLAICKGLTEAMGGEIGVESRVGKGSRFWFEVPAAPAVLIDPKTGPQGSDQISFTGVRVLVADDNPTNRELASLFLTGMGVEISEAVNGEDAAQMAAAFPYDVILMDIQMPVLNGPDALRRIRDSQGPNDTTPILAFTADVTADARVRLLQLGFDTVVEKPINPRALITAVARATAFVEHLQESSDGA
jgi:PAS domain S-box-containing protein